IDELREQAPPPEGADVIVDFVVNLVDADGDIVHADFLEPVTVEFDLPADLVPDGAGEGDLVLAYWNGEAWVEVEASVTINPDGSATLVAEVSHFTLFSVVAAPPAWGTFVPAPAVGITLTTWQGGNYSRLEGAVGFGNSVWVTSGGQLVGYIVGSPTFVNAAFVAMFPDGPTAGQPVVVVR